MLAQSVDDRPLGKNCVLVDVTPRRDDRLPLDPGPAGRSKPDPRQTLKTTPRAPGSANGPFKAATGQEAVLLIR